MTSLSCADDFQDGDGRYRECSQPVGHSGAHSDGSGVSWLGWAMGDAERMEDQ